MREYNSLVEDIRLTKVPKFEALDVIKSFVERKSWVYIKSCEKKIKDDSLADYVVNYNKFKTNNISGESSSGLMYIYGTEDDDRLILSTDDLVQTEISPLKDEVLLTLEYQNTRTQIYIKEFVPNKERYANSLLDIDKNLIITEGKTDWKHLKAALTKFKACGLYEDFDFEFFEYEESLSGGNDVVKKVNGGANTLDIICQYNALFYNEKIRVFVFDTDIPDIAQRYSDDHGYKYLGNNVYALLLPIPVSRQQTPEISIENYYTDSEIMTPNANGERLFLNNEFGFNTSDNANIYPYFSLKARTGTENLIIDNEVYTNCQQLQISNKEELKRLISEGKLNKTRTLSKNAFAENILKNMPPFDCFGIENFKLVFDMIAKIKVHSINESRKKNGLLEKKTLGSGIYIETYLEHQDLNIDLSLPEEQIRKQRGKYWYNGVSLSDGKIEICAGIPDDPICFQLDITPDLISFIRGKKQTLNNRIYLHFYTEQMQYICSNEILSGENGNIALHNLRWL